MVVIERLIFVLGLLPLLVFSWKDIVKAEISNKSITLYGLLSLVTLFLSVNQLSQIIQIIISAVIIFLIFSFTWIKGSLGGGDLKLLPFIIIFLSINSNNLIVTTWIFLVILLILSVPYYFIARTFLKDKKTPFIPILTLNYILIFLFNNFMK